MRHAQNDIRARKIYETSNGHGHGHGDGDGGSSSNKKHTRKNKLKLLFPHFSVQLSLAKSEMCTYFVFNLKWNALIPIPAPELFHIHVRVRLKFYEFAIQQNLCEKGLKLLDSIKFSLSWNTARLVHSARCTKVWQYLPKRFSAAIATGSQADTMKWSDSMDKRHIAVPDWMSVKTGHCFVEDEKLYGLASYMWPILMFVSFNISCGLLGENTIMIQWFLHI